MFDAHRRRARVRIDASLKDAGWNLTNGSRRNLSADN